MIAGGVPVVDLIEPTAFGHVDLASDDGLDAFLDAGFIELHDTVHHTVIGNGNGILPHFLGTPRNIRHAASSVQQAVFAVQMQMGKAFHKSLLLLFLFVDSRRAGEINDLCKPMADTGLGDGRLMSIAQFRHRHLIVFDTQFRRHL